MAQGILGSWLLTGDAGEAPIAGGGVVLDEHGCVMDIGPEAALRDRHSAVHFEKHAAVLMPGLINAHTHLELSALRGRVPGGRGFAPWVDTLLSLRAQTKPELDSEAIDLAVSELLGFGVVAIGEVCNQLHTCDVLAGAALCVSIFHEVFGMRSETAEVMQGMAERERATRSSFPAHMRYALAPHTPYTLHPRFLRGLVERAADSGTRTSLHLAEHAAERAFLASGEGPFADWVKSRGSSEIDWKIPGIDPISYADSLGLLGPHLIAVHLADARPDELALLASRKAQAVLCPRSNLFIDVKLPPLLDILRAGLTPGLGTDSLASNTSLDPLAEARALRKRFPSVPALTLLAMATSWGADALGYGTVLGRLARGHYPGVLAFSHVGSAPSDPASFVLDHESARRSVLSRPKYPALASLMHEVSP